MAYDTLRDLKTSLEDSTLLELEELVRKAYDDLGAVWWGDEIGDLIVELWRRNDLRSSK